MSADVDSIKRGYDHAALCYATDRELVDAATAFLTDGLDGGEALVVALDRPRADLVLAALADPGAVTVLATGDLHWRPAVVIKSYGDLYTRLLDGGARAVRLLGEIPDRALTTAWDVWGRYESAVNYAWDRFPLRSMCAYDTRTTSSWVLDDVAKTHSLVVSAEGVPVRNSRYVEPPLFLSSPRPMVPYPIQDTPPVVDLVVTTPGAARSAVRTANRDSLAPRELDDVVMSVSEVVTNAIKYGTPPIRIRVWTAADHMTVTVHDRGPGPADPFAGLLPAPRPEGGGYGLWLAHQLCHHVTFAGDSTGFTVRLTMGP
ncbi:sensor histidine kinase [Actinokineospora auranticolor]|uniref:Histidine kinase-like protein n=1 Tax=Actinokineospora auranticolor TaxID=155976 RepID=A0A2S6GSW5_9PSEU|nr:sensor histidine kinase [Actinokineospora auranticolor]PPK68279.1 histidine kinase-like protein [Actinokineospora auranticolor]